MILYRDKNKNYRQLWVAWNYNLFWLYARYTEHLKEVDFCLN